MKTNNLFDYTVFKSHVLSLIPSQPIQYAVSAEQHDKEIASLKDTIGNRRFFFVTNLENYEIEQVHGIERWLGYSERDFTMKKYLDILHPGRKKAVMMIAMHLYDRLCKGQYALNFMVQRYSSLIALKHYKGQGNAHHFLNTGLGAMPANSLGQPWSGDYVYNSGDLILDLLHNFFLENGARMNKIRVYEMTDHPTARQMLGYLFVRGGVHALAYAKALEELTGVDVKKMLPIPAIPDSAFKEAQPFTDQGLHGKLYRFSPDDFKDIGAIWHGEHPIDGTPLEVEDNPPEGGQAADSPEERVVSSPGLNMDELQEMAQRLMKNV